MKLWAAVAIAAFLLLAAWNGDRPLHLDDTDFAPAARATAATGRPEFYRGEQNPQNSGLMHPPLYIYLLAAWTRVFGASPQAMRLFGAAAAILAGIITTRILRELFGQARCTPWEPWFWLLYLFNPFTLQVSAILDIDSSIYGPLLLWALLIAVRMASRTTPFRWSECAPLILALTLCEWSKLTTVWLTFPFVFLLLAGRLGVRRSALATAVTAVASAACFAATYAAYGRIVRMDTRYTYEFVWMSFVTRGTRGASGVAANLRALAANASSVIPDLFEWAGAVVWLSAVAALIWAAWAGRRQRPVARYAIVLGLAVAATLGYALKVMTFGSAPFKYVFPYWPVMVTAPVVLMAAARSKPDLVGVGLFASSYLFALAVGLARVKDHIITFGYSGSYRIVFTTLALIFLAACARRVPRFMLWGALGLSAGVLAGTTVYQSRLACSTTYNYGQLGIAETADYLRAGTGPNDLVACMKDLGYLTGRRFFETYNLLYSPPFDRADFERIVTGGVAKFVVFTEDIGEDQLFIAPDVRAWVLEHCVLVRSFGNYRIYQPKVNRRD